MALLRPTVTARDQLEPVIHSISVILEKKKIQLNCIESATMYSELVSLNP